MRQENKSMYLGVWLCCFFNFFNLLLHDSLAEFASLETGAESGRGQTAGWAQTLPCSDLAQSSFLSVYTQILCNSPESPGMIIMSRHSAERSSAKFRPDNDPGHGTSEGTVTYWSRSCLPIMIFLSSRTHTFLYTSFEWRKVKGEDTCQNIDLVWCLCPLPPSCVLLMHSIASGLVVYSLFVEFVKLQTLCVSGTRKKLEIDELLPFALLKATQPTACAHPVRLNSSDPSSSSFKP